jgi:hypothetical protein
VHHLLDPKHEIYLHEQMYRMTYRSIQLPITSMYVCACVSKSHHDTADHIDDDGRP